MDTNEVDRTVVTDRTATLTQAPLPQEPTVTARRETVQTESSRITRTGPGGSEMTRRIVVFIFGLIQIVIVARIVLLVLDAREANGLVSGILNISQVFVGPFEGILRTNNLHSAGSILDLAAVVALIGWSIVEMIVLWVAGIFRREPA